MIVLFVASVVAWTLAAASFGGAPPRSSPCCSFSTRATGALPPVLERRPLGRRVRVLVARCRTHLPAATGNGVALLAVGLVLLVLIRPSNQVLLAFGLLPLFLDGGWRDRLGRSAAFLGTALVLLGGWSAHNAWRYDDSRLPAEQGSPSLSSARSRKSG